jgi:hypothetical protein
MDIIVIRQYSNKVKNLLAILQFLSILKEKEHFSLEIFMTRTLTGTVTEKFLFTGTWRSKG